MALQNLDRSRRVGGWRTLKWWPTLSVLESVGNSFYVFSWVEVGDIEASDALNLQLKRKKSEKKPTRCKFHKG